MEKPKDFQDFIENHWPHLVAEVKSHTRLLYIILAAIIGGALATIVAT